jgi:hypothetical protein
MRFLAAVLLAIPLTIGLARADNLPPGTGFGQLEQSNCLVASFGGQTVVVNEYQTKVTATLNGGTTVFQQTFSAPFNAVSVQTSNSTGLQSSATSFVPIDLPILFACNITINTTASCAGVSVTNTFYLSSKIITFGPATIMTGAANTCVIDQTAVATNSYLDGTTNSSAPATLVPLRQRHQNS